LIVFIRDETWPVRNLIRAPPNAHDLAGSRGISLSDVLFANHGKKIVIWHSREVTIESPAVAAAPWIIDRIIHDRDRKGTEFADQAAPNIGPLINPNQVWPGVLHGLENRTVDFYSDAKGTSMTDPRANHTERPIQSKGSTNEMA
jgi:hypothetical protein